MNEKQKARLILKTLNKIYPKTPIPLKHNNKFTLLISVLLSAQCTDLNVNNVTKKIYPKYYTPKHFVKLGRKNIERLIKSIGIFRIKAKSIYLTSKKILKDNCHLRRVSLVLLFAIWISREDRRLRLGCLVSH